MVIKMVPLTVYLLIINFIHFSLQTKPYNFKPQSRKIEVNEGGNYFIGFDRIGNLTNFEHCYIQSSTINTDYPLHKFNKNDRNTQYVQPKGFKPFNNPGICAFGYFSVDNKTPLKWIISVSGSETKKNFTEEVTVKLFYNMPLYQDRMVALVTASAINFYYSGTNKLIKCSIGFENTTIQLDMNAIKVYIGNHVFKSRLTSLGGGRCGYKINNLTSADPIDLTLYATDDENKMYRNTSKLIVVKQNDYLKNRTLQVYLGDSASVICGKESDSSANNDQKFCHLYNPQGILVSHDHLCDYKLDIVTIDDLGTWTCSVGYNYIMDALEFSTRLVEKSTERVETFKSDTKNFYIIGCQLVNYTNYKLQYCKFTRPDGKIFKVTTGGASPNYNTLSTDLDKGKCSIEILKPLRNEDKGTWKCEAASFGDTSGAFLNVEKATVVPYHKYSQKNIQLGNSFVIDCVVPYSSDYCYIVAPNGTQYQPDNRLQITSGLCLFTVDKAAPTDNGTWQCSIAQSNGIPDEIITVEVSIIELKMLYYNAEVAEDEEVELICNTNGIPIEYCRFVSPTGLSYSLRKNNLSSNNISYVGRGLEYGDCGIKISTIEATHRGKWHCHISSGRHYYRNKADLTRTIELSVIPPRSAIGIVGAVAISMGIVLVMMLVGGFIFSRYSGRLQCRVRNSQDTMHYSQNINSDSNEDVVLAVPQNNYNTQLGTTNGITQRRVAH